MAKRVNVASEFLEAMQEAADILTGERDPARAWHPLAMVDVKAIRTTLETAGVVFTNGDEPGAKLRKQGQ